ncbi:hypothetical protein FISHEDRAFT_65369 [Fistulina hepatica ATCC 64428]|nr:hypothetical protein FISHEDRAFT_65369 [Fistulina hepatica ATCC 64428]
MTETLTVPKAADTSAQDARRRQARKAIKSAAEGILLVVFIHGFKGTDATFLDFPSRLQHLLAETVPDLTAECVIFPAYETKGDLSEAVVRFADWLTTKTVEREVAAGGGAGCVKIVLCGHSMGGLLAADTLHEFVTSRPDRAAPLWPKIIACIAYDTPYFGLHPHVFKNQADKATQHVNSIRSLASVTFGSLAGLAAAKNASTDRTPDEKALPEPKASSSSSLPKPTEQTGWARWAPAIYAIGGAVVAGAAAGGLYYNREDLGVGYTWATDHMRYVGVLWDEPALKRRVETLIDTEEKEGVLFRTFYAEIPPPLPVLGDSMACTFIILPRLGARSRPHFIPMRNGLARDELQAHTGMFSSKTNDGYYQLGLETAKIIREAVMLGRGVFHPDDTLGVLQDNAHASPRKDVMPKRQESIKQTSMPKQISTPKRTSIPKQGLVPISEPPPPKARDNPSSTEDITNRPITATP